MLLSSPSISPPNFIAYLFFMPLNRGCSFLGFRTKDRRPGHHQILEPENVANDKHKWQIFQDGHVW